LGAAAYVLFFGTMRVEIAPIPGTATSLCSSPLFAEVTRLLTGWHPQT
jgi:hypothetical protein